VAPFLGLFQARVQADGRSRRANQARLRELRAAHGGEVEVFCAHDEVELARYHQPTSST
jgi:hypothetical protein